MAQPGRRPKIAEPLNLPMAFPRKVILCFSCFLGAVLLASTQGVPSPFFFLFCFLTRWEKRVGRSLTFRLLEKLFFPTAESYGFGLCPGACKGRCQGGFGGLPPRPILLSFEGNLSQGALKDTCCPFETCFFHLNKGKPPFTRQCSGV